MKLELGVVPKPQETSAAIDQLKIGKAASMESIIRLVFCQIMIYQPMSSTSTLIIPLVPPQHYYQNALEWLTQV